VIFATTALTPGDLKVDSGEAHEFLCKTIKDAFSGIGKYGGNYHMVLAHIIVSLKTNAYTNIPGVCEKEAGNGEFTSDAACGVD
jgi:hypothetical protein